MSIQSFMTLLSFKVSGDQLMFLSKQLSLLKESLVKEQLRLNLIIEEKDKKIREQDQLIRKLQRCLNLFQIQRSQTDDQAANNVLRCTNNDKDDRIMINNSRPRVVSLRRQPKFTRGSERPIVPNRVRPSVSCQNISFLGIGGKSLMKNQHDIPGVEKCIVNNEQEIIIKEKGAVSKSLSEDTHDKESGFGSFRSQEDTDFNKINEEAKKENIKKAVKNKRERRKTTVVNFQNLQNII